ncbi:UNVERIFIED_CONTAM: hypothetical protein Slati_4444300 [Sesamum latifolium]|uniref:Reverse transcriptase domain-containing protein n=1 Tax=Sesamum latifolium TaxID=2727402 RepID=A0AAW2STB9_9LAMI
MKEDVREQVINCLRKNKNIFAWTPQDPEGIDPGVITHHLNLHPTIKLVKQKKWHFGPKKDKIIQGEVKKQLAAGHIREIQFPEWLSNVVLVPKPDEKWRMCIDFQEQPGRGFRRETLVASHRWLIHCTRDWPGHSTYHPSRG